MRSAIGQGFAGVRLGRGFTLIELLTTVSVVAILASIATPLFTQFILGQRVRAAAYNITSALIYARSEAIKRNANITITAASGGWQNGWTVASGATTLMQQESLKGLTVSGPTAGLVYGGNGRLTAGVAPFSVSTSSSGVQGRCVSVTLSGMPSSQAGSC